MRRTIAVAVLLCACTKREEAKPTPEGTPTAAPKDPSYTLAQLTCYEGTLGATPPPAPSAIPSASTTAPPPPSSSLSIKDIFGGDVGGGMLAPIDDGGVGFGLGIVGTGGGFGGGIGAARRRLHHPITIAPSLAGGDRVMSVAKTVCAATAELRRCHSESGLGAMVVAMDLTVADGKATAKHGSQQPEAFGACFANAVSSLAFEPTASGATTLRITYGPGRFVQPPTIKETSPTIGPGLPPEVVRRIVRMRIGQLRACYELGLRTDPKLAGNLNVEFSIDKDGNVASAKIASGTLADEPVRTCILGRFRAMAFPQPEGGASVSVKYPLDFKPSE